MIISHTGKRVLVTGGSRGIGRATVKAFLDAGACVVLTGRSEASVAEALAALGSPDRLFGVTCDVAKVADCRRMVAHAESLLGGLDVLVTSAGVVVTGPLEEIDEAAYDHMLDVNLKGTFFAIQAALPALRASGGNIVCVASDAGLIGEIGLVVYSASKGGVVNMTKALALELAPDVRVNCVCPGNVDTDMTRRDGFERAADPAAAEQRLIDYAPLKRMASADEVAGAVLYLASEHAKFITGAALQMDGGSTAGQARRA